MAAGGMALAYIISVLFTPLLVINLLVAMLVFGVICFGLARRYAGVFALERPKRFALTLSLVSAFVIVTLGALPTFHTWLFPAADTVTASLLSALQAHTFSLETVQAERGFDDLQPLTSILADKRIVALGEATHGTSEFFRMRHRMVEFLVREMGFAHFGMETDAHVGYVLDDYINGGQGNPRDVLYWPWATVEVVEMLDWMRAYNADPASPHRLHFHGIDPRVGERDRRMAENVAGILAWAGPESKMVLWAHNGHIANTAAAWAIISSANGGTKRTCWGSSSITALLPRVCRPSTPTAWGLPRPITMLMLSPDWMSRSSFSISGRWRRMRNCGIGWQNRKARAIYRKCTPCCGFIRPGIRRRPVGGSSMTAWFSSPRVPRLLACEDDVICANPECSLTLPGLSLSVSCFSASWRLWFP